MDSPRPLALTLLSIYFACVGFASLVSSAASWHFGSTIPWLGLGYASMNLLLSSACYMRERWPLPALVLNCAGYSSLYLALWLFQGDVNLPRVLLSTLLAAGAAGIVYVYREKLSRSRYIYAGYAFLALWILVFTYSAIVVL